MPFSVTTNNVELSAALRPDAYYPDIQTNGAVSTDDECDYSDAEEPPPASPTAFNKATTASKTVRLATHDEEGLDASGPTRLSLKV